MIIYDGMNLKIKDINDIYIVKEKEIINVSINELQQYLDLDLLSLKFYYFYKEKEKIYFSTNIKYYKDNNFILEYDMNSEKLLIEFGYVLPPYTIYKDVYRIFPFSELDITNFSKGILEIKSKKWNLNKKNITKPSIEYKEELEKILKQNIEKKISKNKKNIFTLSGGADSSLLLALASKLLKDVDSLALTVQSPGQEEELERAKKLCKNREIEHKILNIKNIDYNFIAEKYMKIYLEPVYDNLMPIQYKMIEENCVRNESIIFEGQGADSLYLGLPHNIVCINYEKIKKLSFIFKILYKILSLINIKKNNKLGRTLYRLKKVANLYKKNSRKEFIYSLLGIQNLYKDKNYLVPVYMTIDKLLDEYDLQYAIAYFFMYRILPVREMQKYRLLKEEGYEFVFPFITNEAIENFYSIPKEMMIDNKNRKKILFDLCKINISEVDFKGKTSPFYTEAKLIIKNEIKIDSDIKRKNIENIEFIEDNIKSYQALKNLQGV